jgi:hypothetical protein
MNKTVVYVTFACLVALGIVGTLLLLFIAPQHFGTFTGFLIVLFGVATTAAANFWQLGKAKEELQNVKTETSTKLDVVQRQTNGTLSKLIADLNEANELLRRKDRAINDLEASLLNRPKRGLGE